MSEQSHSIVIGDEYDEKLREVLIESLRYLGADPVEKEFSVAGSQEMESLVVDINGSPLTVEAETYIGLTISGSKPIVEQVLAEVKRRMA